MTDEEEKLFEAYKKLSKEKDELISTLLAKYNEAVDKYTVVVDKYSSLIDKRLADKEKARSILSELETVV